MYAIFIERNAKHFRSSILRLEPREGRGVCNHQSTKDSQSESRQRQLGKRARTPHFDRHVGRAGDDGLAVRGEGDGRDLPVVGALLTRLELQSI